MAIALPGPWPTALLRSQEGLLASLSSSFRPLPQRPRAPEGSSSHDTLPHPPRRRAWWENLAPIRQGGGGYPAPSSPHTLLGGCLREAIAGNRRADDFKNVLITQAVVLGVSQERDDVIKLIEGARPAVYHQQWLWGAAGGQLGGLHMDEVDIQPWEGQMCVYLTNKTVPYAVLRAKRELPNHTPV